MDSWLKSHGHDDFDDVFHLVRSSVCKVFDRFGDIACKLRADTLPTASTFIENNSVLVHIVPFLRLSGRIS